MKEPPPAPPGGRMTVRGVPVAPGLAVGAALFHDEDDLDVPVLRILPEAVEAEEARLHQAVAEARLQLAQVERSIGEEVGRRDARIFSVQSLLLDDPAFQKGMGAAIRDQLVNAEVAVRDTVTLWSERLSGMSAVAGGRDPVADLRDVGRQLIRLLVGQSRAAGALLADAPGAGRVILVTRELLPSDTVHLDRRRLAGIVTASGGAASHAAILARGLGIPAVTDVDVSRLPSAGGDWIVDGTRGQVVLNPTEEDLAYARAGSEEFQRVRVELLDRTRGLARTADGVAIELMANVENFTTLPEEMVDGLGGVGLYRTEFLFMSGASIPSQEEQYAHYVQVLERLDGREVTFRTIDVGGDKPLPSLRVAPEPNPVLGWRGLRLSLEWPDLFYTQIRALLRASHHGRMRILLPMITQVEELRQARGIVREIARDLDREGVPFDRDVKVGAMIEVPAAALAASAMAAECDFFSVGTNDLSQYALAVDRNNARVAHLYRPLHPGVIALVRQVLRAAAAAGTPVSVCGEMAGEPDAALLLLGLGLRSFSMSPYHLPAVRELFAQVGLEHAASVAKRALELTTATEIRALLRAEVLQLAPRLEPLLPRLDARR